MLLIKKVKNKFYLLSQNYEISVKKNGINKEKTKATFKPIRKLVRHGLKLLMSPRNYALRKLKIVHKTLTLINRTCFQGIRVKKLVSKRQKREKDQL